MIKLSFFQIRRNRIRQIHQHHHMFSGTRAASQRMDSPDISESLLLIEPAAISAYL
jgi:hypothetical protein